MTWLTLECESAHFVMRGRETILCDRLPHPVTLVVKLARIEAGTDETPKAAQPTGQEPDQAPKGTPHA